MTAAERNISFYGKLTEEDKDFLIDNQRASMGIIQKRLENVISYCNTHKEKINHWEIIKLATISFSYKELAKTAIKENNP